MQLRLGERAPSLVGATADGRFYSLDAQAGRGALLIAMGCLSPTEARDTLRELRPARAALQAAGVDLVAVAPVSSSLVSALAGDAEARAEVIHVVEAGGLERLEVDGKPAVIAIDRGGRIVDLFSLEDPSDLLDRCASVSALLASEPPRQRSATAPILIIPNVTPRDLCRALIDGFEASPHAPGAMASLAAGRPADKLDAAQKLRRDFELSPASELGAQVLSILAERCLPELRRAFQRDVGLVDRILLARYDVGGHFKRHRDNLLPHTAFREFAVTLNLNTEDYEGGCLVFPEYSDDFYNPPTGSAAIFSASLLHEVTPVRSGVRYAALTFLSSRPPGG